MADIMFYQLYAKVFLHFNEHIIHIFVLNYFSNKTMFEMGANSFDGNWLQFYKHTLKLT